VRRSEHKEDADKIRKTRDILIGKLQEKKTLQRPDINNRIILKERTKTCRTTCTLILNVGYN
jgi:hypothetical protein